jgi:ABC-2 type transport system permease protein
MNLTPFAALVKKVLLLFFKDRRSVMMSFAAPIAIASFFGLVLGGSLSKNERQRIHIWFVDEDRSAVSANIVARLGAEHAIEVKTGTAEAAREEVRAGQAAAAVIIGKGFGAKAGGAMFGGPDKPPLTLLYDPSRGAEHEMVKGMLAGNVMQVVAQEIFGGGAATRSMISRSLNGLRQDRKMSKGERKALTEMLQSVDKWSAITPAESQPSGMSAPYQLNEEAITARPEAPYNSFAHSFTGMGVQFILFMGIEAGVMLLQQRQRGLWKRLRAAPVSRSMLLSSRAVSAALSALLIMAVLFTFARLVFNVRIEGSFPGFLLVCLAFALMTAAFGLLVAAIGKTPEATRPLAIFVTLIMVMLGGSWVPSFLFPSWLDKATKIVPTRWAVDGLNGMTWRGLGLDYALTCSGVLLIFAAVFAAVAVRQFRWESD